MTTRHPLGDLMNRVVASDPAAIGEFVELARPKVRCIQRRALGAKGITVGREQLDDMAGDGVVELLRLAPGWCAVGGAAPWHWAAQRLRAIAFSSLGHLGVSLDELQESPDLGHAPAPSHSGSFGVSTVERLARHDRGVRRLVEGLREIRCSDRDIAIWLEVAYERSIHNERAGVTVATGHDLSHACVRQVVSRVNRRLKHLATLEDWADLAALPVLAR